MGSPLPAGGLSEVLLSLHARRATGLLEVYADHRVYRLVIRRGDPVHLSPGREPARLGDVLRGLGEVRTSGDPVSGRRRDLRIGEALVEGGLVSAAGVERALAEQLRLRAVELLSLRRGSSRFWDGVEHLSDLPRQPSRWTMPGLVAAARGPAAAPKPQGRRLSGRLHRELARLEGEGDPLRALGLTPGAPAEAIGRAFRELAREHHPDRLVGVTDPAALSLHRRAFAAALRARDRALALSGC